MSNNVPEFLVTGQGYEKNDPYKQTILLHESFFVHDEIEAKNLFNNKFRETHKIVKIYSVIDVTTNNI